jgi:LPXTG-site transpeptidase (sortase) family protein
MVLEGDGDDVLGEAAGHVPATALPGGPGNVAIAGHRDTFFRALRNIRRDDEITVATTSGTFRYRVESLDRVKPQDVQVLKASDHPTLTLITCYPFNYIGPAPMRFVVAAKEIRSTQAGGGQLLASAVPVLDLYSAGGKPVDRLSASADLNSATAAGPPARANPNSVHGAARSRSTRVPKTSMANGSRSSQAMTDSQQDDVPTESTVHSHKKLGKVRAWLGSIPRRFSKNHAAANAAESN